MQDQLQPGHAPIRGQVPSTARGRATRRRILAAAEREFTNKGYDRTSIARITMRARVAVGTCYLYFSSKEDVLRTLVRDFGRQLDDRLSRCAPRSGAPEEMQRLCLEAYIRFRASHRGLDRIVNAAEWVDRDVFRDYYENLARALRLEQQRDAGANEANGPPPKKAPLGADDFLRLWQTIARPGRLVEPEMDTSQASAVTG